MLPAYQDDPPSRETIDAGKASLLLEFGSNSCGICQAADPIIAEAVLTLAVPHIRVQDGKGKRLGRSYQVKLWPTLILIRDGQEIARVVRPQSTKAILSAFQ